MSGTELVHYNAMCQAITEAELTTRLAAIEHCFLFPQLPGVYVFDRMGAALYVGESRNLHRRLTHHERGYLRRTVCVRLRIVPCSNHKQAERWLIATLRPTLNGVSEQARRMPARAINLSALWAEDTQRLAKSL